MKKILALVLTLTLITMLLAGCGGNSGTAEPLAPAQSSNQVQSSDQAQPAGSGAPTEAPPEAPAKVYELNISSQAAELSINAVYLKMMAEKIDEVTNGQVKLTIYFSSALVGETDVVSAIRNGIADGGEVPMARQANAFPLSNLIMTPFSNLGDGTGIYENIFLPLYEKYPEMQAEYAGLHIGGFYITTNGGTLHTNHEVRIPSDLHGDMIVAPTSFQNRITSDAGGSPMVIDVGDWYSSFERGLAQGMWMSWGAITSMDIYKVLPYHTIFPNGTDRGITLLLFNGKVWDSMPADCQEAIESVIAWGAEQWVTIEAEDFQPSIQLMEEAGNTFSEMTPEEEAQWHELATAAKDEAIAALDEKGLPGTAFYNDVLAFAENNK